MVEKGTERHRSSNGSAATFSKKGQVRVIKNSNLNHGQVEGGSRSLAASPTKSEASGGASGRGCFSPDSFVGAGGVVKKGKRAIEPLLSMSPTARSGAFGGNSSPRNSTPRSSPSLGYHYAGAKFSEPPSPDSLPKPPTHWNMTALPLCQKDQYFEISQQLRMLLKVQA